MVQFSNIMLMFVASPTKRFSNIEHVAGCFYVLKRSFVSKDMRLSNPCSCCSSAITVSWSRWEAIAFFILICIHISLNMTKRNEICNAGKNSTRKATLNSTKTVSISDYEIEKNAKNKAYYFILTHNLLSEFSAFCRSYNSSDPQKDCLNFILSNLK